MAAFREIERAAAGVTEASTTGTDALSFGLWSLAVLIAALALPDANWADHLWIVPAIAVEGLLLGWFLVASRFSAGRVILLSAGYGVVLILWHAAALLDPADAWRQRAFDVTHRLGDFARLVAAGIPSYDSLPFVLGVSVVFWFIAALGTWSLFKKGRLWQAILLAGIAVFLNDYFYGVGDILPLHLPLFLLAILALLVRLELVGYRRGWESRGAHVAPFASLQVMQAGVLLSLALVAVAWIGPRLPELHLPRGLGNAGAPSAWEEAFSDALAGLRGPAAVVAAPFGASLQLGPGQAAGAGEIFSATFAQPLPQRARVYWRARVFDTYVDGVWTTKAAVAGTFGPARDDLPDPEHAGRVAAEFEISPASSGMSVLLLPAEVAWFDVPATTEQVVARGSVDLVEATSAVPLQGGGTYRVRSRIAVPLAEDLRRAAPAGTGAVPPEDLEVPDDLAMRITALTTEVTRGAATDFDRAEAVIDWLRTNMRYLRESPAPPAAEDPVAWFLFDSREGFCDYYASAAVLMLRSIGVPSRLAVGYAQGTYDPAARRYVVQADDSHAWPEVYFPAFGWIEFEPTASEPPLDRGEALVAGAGGVDELQDLLVPRTETTREPLTEGEQLLGPAGNARPEPWPGFAPTLVIFLAGLMIASAAVLVSAQARRVASRVAVAGTNRLGLRAPQRIVEWSSAPTSEATVVFRRLAPWPERLGVRLPGEPTPLERARALARVVPDSAGLIGRIADEYVAERYGERPSARGEAGRAWRTLRPRLYRLRLARLIHARVRPDR